MWFFRSRRNGPVKSARRSWSCRPRLEVLEDRCLLSGGQLDPTFGQGGLVTTAFSNQSGVSQGQASALALQPDGKLVAAGWSLFGKQAKGFTLARYTSGGALDGSFGNGGIVQTPPPSHAEKSEVRALALQNDGKIVAIGEASVSPQTSGNDTEFVLARYNPNGTLDTGFGGGKSPTGVVLTNLGSDLDEAGSVAIQPDGKIVVAGYQRVVTATQTIYKAEIVRYNANGTLDTAFGSGGIVQTPGLSGTSGLVIQSDGKLLVGVGADGFGLARYLPTGQLDPSFGTGGVTTGYLPPGATSGGVGSVLLRGDGTIYAVGSTQTWDGTTNTYYVALTHFTSGGQLDTAFGSGGWATDSRLDSPSGAVLAPNGDIMVAGRSTNRNPGDFALEAFLPGGALDTSFGTNGRVTTDFASSDDGARAIVVQPDGKVVLAGYGANGTTGKPATPSYRFALARYLPSSPQVGSFSASAYTVASGDSVTLTASNITDGNPSSAITQVTFYYIDGNGTQKVLGYGTQTSSGVWTLNYTVNLSPGLYTIYAQAQDNYGALGDPISLTLTVQ
jgi:uncharacterized delta-60 repeat protein